MIEDTGTPASEDVTTKTSAAAAETSAAADAAPAADTAKPKPGNGADAPPADDDEKQQAIDAVRVKQLYKVIRNAAALAGLRSSYGLLQVASFLIDEACEGCNRTHAEGLETVTELLQLVQKQRDEAEESVASMLGALQDALRRSRDSKPKESAQG